jgi:hypothetical protein
LAGLSTSAIIGDLTLTKAGTSPRTLTAPDATGTIALTTDTPTPLTGLATTGITGTLTLTKFGSTPRTITIPDASGTISLLERAQTFTAAQTFSAAQTFTNILYDGGGGGIRRSIDTGYLALSGSTAIDTTAARIEVVGKTHATLANLINIFGDNKVFGATSGATQMTLDTNGNLVLGATPTAGNGLLQLASGTTKANGIAFGTDTFLYRSYAGLMYLDGQVSADRGLYLTTGTVTGYSFVAHSLAAYLVGSLTNHPMQLRTNNTERAIVKTTGQIRFVPLSADPAGAETGDVYYNSTTNKLRVYNGAWVDLH